MRTIMDLYISSRHTLRVFLVVDYLKLSLFSPCRDLRVRSFFLDDANRRRRRRPAILRRWKWEWRMRVSKWDISLGQLHGYRCS